MTDAELMRDLIAAECVGLLRVLQSEPNLEAKTRALIRAKLEAWDIANKEVRKTREKQWA